MEVVDQAHICESARIAIIHIPSQSHSLSNKHIFFPAWSWLHLNFWKIDGIPLNFVNHSNLTFSFREDRLKHLLLIKLYANINSYFMEWLHFSRILWLQCYRCPFRSLGGEVLEITTFSGPAVSEDDTRLLQVDILVSMASGAPKFNCQHTLMSRG